MIKGIKKNMVVLKNTGSPVFEEAYFILKSGGNVALKDADMVTEAKRIIAANTVEPERAVRRASEKRKEKRGKLLFFAIGVITGAIALCVAVLLIL